MTHPAPLDASTSILNASQATYGGLPGISQNHDRRSSGSRIQFARSSSSHDSERHSVDDESRRTRERIKAENRLTQGDLSGFAPEPQSQPDTVPVGMQIVDDDGTWGGKFWVTIVDPMVSTYRLVVRTRHSQLNALNSFVDAKSVLCLSSHGTDELGTSCRPFCVRIPCRKFPTSELISSLKNAS